MISGVIRFALNQRALVLMLTALLIGLGVWSFQRLPIDAVPDITTTQVQINTPVKALAPAEVEKLVTFPIETAMSGIPKADEIRSLTRYGLSQVTVVFEDGTDIYWARQQILERLQEARERLPQGLADPVMGPITTGLGEIFSYTVEGDSVSPTELRTVQDWVIRPQLRTVPGVIEVNSIGGFEKQYHVTPDPMKLASYGLTFRDIFEALTANNANAGGAYIAHKGEQYLIRGVGLLRDAQDIEQIVLTTQRGTPVYLRDVAEVGLGEELRTGAATEQGREVVLGTAMMLMGENSRTVSMRVREKLQDIRKMLAKGITIKPVYDRTVLVNQTLETVRNNLFEGAVLVLVVLLLLLGNIRAAFIVASVIPLSMLFALTGMVQGKVSGNLMSLGAIDFGLIVDGAVVMVENIVRRLTEQQHALGRVLTRVERHHTLTDAALEVGRPVAFAVGIIMIVYLPILTLHGIEGKMFKPMAFTVLLALGGALVLSLTLIPVLCSLAMHRKVSERGNLLVGLLKRAYKPTLRVTWRLRWAVVIAATVLVAVALWLFLRLGAVFVPQLDEGSLVVQAWRLPSISLDQSLAMQTSTDKLLMEVPEVENVFTRIGTAEVATDPMPISLGESIVLLKPRRQWPNAKTRDELIEEMRQHLEALPGQRPVFTQPIQMRFDELIAGVRADVAVKIFGDDMGVLQRFATQIRSMLAKVPGAEDIEAEQVSGLPVLQLEVDRDKIARYGLNVADVLGLIETAIGGKRTGQLFEGEQRFDIIVRLPAPMRENIDEIKQLTVRTPDGALIPLHQLARIEIVEGLNQISREHAKRRIAVQANVRGRDIDGFVKEARERIAREIEPKLPEGYYLEWGGQFQNLQAARQRLTIVVPLALALIFFLLFSAFKSVRQSILISTGVPLAVTGGVFALALRGLPFSISAGVGFIALSGVAVLNGVVMVSYINRLRDEGRSIAEAVTEGALTRLRPVLMTAMVASLGFVPMALATGTGAEVQRPLATVVIGGIMSSTLLTLVVLPVLYRWFEREAANEGTHQ
ncbi:MAG: efflux RND transporter permease subunit [candidate division Zixibacteria bacterium]|nr:efflux RND transporter permease subunit [candidate division Zixibacteria bacterium]